MTNETNPGTVEACPFCDAAMSHCSDKDGEFWMHPGTVTDGDCFMSGQGIFLRQLTAWNTRAAQSQPAATVQEIGREVERMAYGYELMFRAICNIAGTSGARESWYRQQADEMLERLSPLHSLTADSNQHKPGDCLSQYKKFSPSKAVEPAPEQGTAAIGAEAGIYAAELREIAGMLAQQPDGPVRWKQYRLAAIADYLSSLTQPVAAPQAEMAGDIGSGNRDCLAKRRPGEPMFILLGRDPDAHNIVRLWAQRRLEAGDPSHATPVLALAGQMEDYTADPANAPTSAPEAKAYPPITPPQPEGGTVLHAERLEAALTDNVGNVFGWLRGYVKIADLKQTLIAALQPEKTKP